MPSLREGVLCTFSSRTSATAAGFARSSQLNSELQTRASGAVRQKRRHGPYISLQISPGWVTLLKPARRASILGHLSSLRPHWFAKLLATLSTPFFVLKHLSSADKHGGPFQCSIVPILFLVANPYHNPCNKICSMTRISTLNIYG